MSTKFMGGTPHAHMEMEMQQIPGFRPRRSGMTVSRFSYTPADCACRYCTRKPEKKNGCIADEIKELKKKRAKAVRERQLAESYDQRVQDMESYMKKTNYLKREFDDDLVRRLLQTVKVINENKLEIQFKSGIVMTQRMDGED